MKIKMSVPRWVHFLRAFFCNYFWIPCPLCGKKFGGHEKPAGFLMKTGSVGEITCPKCRTLANERNKEFMRNNPRYADGIYTTQGLSIEKCGTTCMYTGKALLRDQLEYAKKFSVGDTSKGPPPYFPVQETPKDAVQCTNSLGGLYWRAPNGSTYWTPPDRGEVATNA